MADDLIAHQPSTASPHLLKADLLRDHAMKFSEIEKAIQLNPYSVQARANKALFYIEEANRSYGEQKKEAIANAHSEIDTGLSRDPSIRNPCWRLLFDLIELSEHDNQCREQKLDEVISRLSAMDPESYRVLSFRERRLSSESASVEFEKFMSDVETAKQRRDPSAHADIEELRLQAIAKCGDTKRVTAAIVAVESNYDLVHNADLAVVVAKVKRKRLGLDEEAAVLMEDCLKTEFDQDAAELLIETLVDLDRPKEAEEIFEKWKNRLSITTRSQLKMNVLEGKGDLDGALAELTSYCAQSGVQLNVQHLYLLLKKGAVCANVT